MTSKNDYVVCYAPLPSSPTPQHVVVLPLYRPPPSRRRIHRYLAVATVLFLLSLAIFLLYPSDPTIKLARVRLNHVQVKSSHGLSLDLSFSLTIKVYNRDFFSLDYNSLVVSVGYRGRELGFVSSQGGRVRARASSYVNATLDLNGYEVIHDAFYLIEDLARGVIPFDTDTEVSGVLGLFFFQIPLEARVSCEVYVNSNNQTIVRQDCYPENDATHTYTACPKPWTNKMSTGFITVERWTDWIVLCVFAIDNQVHVTDAANWQTFFITGSDRKVALSHWGFCRWLHGFLGAEDIRIGKARQNQHWMLSSSLLLFDKLLNFRFRVHARFDLQTWGGSWGMN